ncbi:MAG: polyprenol monophosphomannose synthase [Gemmataceae bacterium]|nr:polyprenol monophosphomannose synthase [Gemmataceae bacterium]
MQESSSGVGALAEPCGTSAPPGRLLVTLATYNERPNLASLIQAIHQQAPWADILVIDDNSPDGTGQLADELAAIDPRIRVLHRPGKLGLGTATLAGIRFALDEGYDFLLNLDADFSHPPRYIPDLLRGMARGKDIMIGSRYVPGGGTQNWPWLRLTLSRSVNRLVRLLFRLPVRDASGAFRCFRVAKLRDVPLERLRSRGYSFQQELLWRCYEAGCQLGETPIIFENRRAGRSKVNWYEAMRSLSMLIWLGLGHRFRRLAKALGYRPTNTTAPEPSSISSSSSAS